MIITCHTKWIINSLWPIDAIWQHRSGSTLTQGMAYCLMETNYYLNHCWLIISDFLLHSPVGNFTGNNPDINPWYELENKKHSESANLRVEEHEIVYWGLKQSSQLLLVSISLKCNEYPSIRYSVMLTRNKDLENKKINPVEGGGGGGGGKRRGLKASSLKRSRLFLRS